MESATSQVSFENDKTSDRRTWRAVFRVLMIILALSSLCVTVAALIYSAKAAIPGNIDASEQRILSSVEAVQVPVSRLEDTSQKIYRQVILEAPVTQLNMETNILNAITSLSYQIDASANSSGCGAPVHDSDFTGGVGRELLQEAEVNLTIIRPSKFLEHLNFIPAPTTGNGCTRIPSFDLGQTHWCYTHNVVLNGCRDRGHSFQYVALGILRTSATGSVFLSTLRSVNLDDDRNRKSCSVSATPIGCEMLCSLVTETEEGDYDSIDPTPMVHGRLGFDGKYREVDLSEKEIFADWRANYPAVGGGAFFGNRVWFPVYGGLKEGTQSERDAEKGYAIYKRFNNTCPDDNTTQIANAKASYRPSRFGGRFIQQGILSFKVEGNLGSDPILSLTDNSITLMGAEARVMNIENKLYLYQRGTSWFPSALVYPLDVANTAVKVRAPYIFDKFTRPGGHPCSASSRCPNVCVTGVYTDAYPLVFSRSHDIVAVYGMQLAAGTARLDPQAAIWYGNEMSTPTKVSSSTTKAAYTTSTCFKVTKTKRIYCISIAEIGNTLFGEFRIVPLLIEVQKTPLTRRSELRQQMPQPPIDLVIDNPFCAPSGNLSRKNAIDEYANSWP
ncbi:hemagglutinin-neuraminidase [avian paramyxovirus 12]|uniref:Hemagglutinin-neuraminidase n=1 Tax=avian paramyxovirus 12 TaxID=2560320 RepID=M4R3H5_9MONO|nr:hemagglutinin-neuraminidase [Avian orthoavulavirus 12]AGH32602.1 hemagglutinin-neuraminidase [Avian orthoavulavirus 12]